MEIKPDHKLLNIELIFFVFILINISIGGDIYWHTSASNSIKDIIVGNRSFYLNGLFIPNYLLLGFFLNLTSFLGLLPTIFGVILLLTYSSNTLSYLRKEKRHQIYIIVLPIYFSLVYYFSATNLFLITLFSLIFRRFYKIKDDSFLPIIIIWCSPIGLLASPIFFIFDKKNRRKLLLFSIFSLFLLFTSQPFLGKDNIYNETIRYFDLLELTRADGGILKEILIGRFRKILLFLIIWITLFITFKKLTKIKIYVKQLYYSLIIIPFILILFPLILSIQQSPSLVNSFFLEKPLYVERVFRCTWLPRILDNERCANVAFDRVMSYSYYKN